MPSSPSPTSKPCMPRRQTSNAIFASRHENAHIKIQIGKLAPMGAATCSVSKRNPGAAASFANTVIICRKNAPDFGCAQSGLQPLLNHRYSGVAGFARQHAGVNAEFAQGAIIFLADIAAEDQVRISAAMQPAIVLDFVLQLSRRPAR